MPSIVTLTLNPSIDISGTTASIVPVRKLRCTGVRREPGGGGINVARVISRLGGHSVALFPVGGSTGHLLRRMLDKEGVVSVAIESTADTRENFTILDESTGQQYRFVLPGAQLDKHEWQACLDRIASLAEPPQYIVASGSLPEGVPDDFYARVIRIGTSLGSRVILDTSGAALAAALEVGVYLVKPSLRELTELTGRQLQSEADWIAAAGDLVNSGKSEVVMLTLGEKGALMVTGDGTLRAPGIKVKLDSAVGAGDSFVAALVYRLANGSNLEDAFAYGVAAGTAALLTPGTQLALKPDIDDLLGRVTVEHLPPAG